MLAKRLRVLQTFTREPDEKDVHFIGLVLVIGTIGMLNLRVFGKQVPISALNRLVPWGIAGFGMNVVTGLWKTARQMYLYGRIVARNKLQPNHHHCVIVQEECCTDVTLQYLEKLYGRQ